MPLDPEFVAILVCPACKTELIQKGEDRLHCTRCRRSFPVRDEIPILLLDEAVIEETTPAEVGS